MDELGKPYYLKIYYYPHDVSKNQVVCAIGDFLDFYEITFFKPEANKKFSEDTKGLTWEYRHQEHHIREDDIDEPEMFATQRDYLDYKKWIDEVMKNHKTRIINYQNDDGTKTTYYSLRECDVWIGG